MGYQVSKLDSHGEHAPGRQSHHGEAGDATRPSSSSSGWPVRRTTSRRPARAWRGCWRSSIGASAGTSRSSGNDARNGDAETDRNMGRSQIPPLTKRFAACSRRRQSHRAVASSFTNRVPDKVSGIPGQNGHRFGITLFQIRLPHDRSTSLGVHKNPVLRVLAKEGNARKLPMIREGSSEGHAEGSNIHTKRRGEQGPTMGPYQCDPRSKARCPTLRLKVAHGRKERETNH